MKWRVHSISPTSHNCPFDLTKFTSILKIYFLQSDSNQDAWHLIVVDKNLVGIVKIKLLFRCFLIELKYFIVAQ
jgi:hypothetical protein